MFHRDPRVFCLPIFQEVRHAPGCLSHTKNELILVEVAPRSDGPGLDDAAYHAHTQPLVKIRHAEQIKEAM